MKKTIYNKWRWIERLYSKWISKYSRELLFQMEVWKELMVNDVNSIGKYFRQLISKWEFKDSDYYCYYNCLSEIDYFFLYITLGYYWVTITAVQNWLLFFICDLWLLLLILAYYNCNCLPKKGLLDWILFFTCYLWLLLLPLIFYSCNFQIKIIY